MGLDEIDSFHCFIHNGFEIGTHYFGCKGLSVDAAVYRFHLRSNFLHTFRKTAVSAYNGCCPVCAYSHTSCPINPMFCDGIVQHVKKCLCGCACLQKFTKEKVLLYFSLVFIPYVGEQVGKVSYIGWFVQLKGKNVLAFIGDISWSLAISSILHCTVMYDNGIKSISIHFLECIWHTFFHWESGHPVRDFHCFSSSATSRCRLHYFLACAVYLELAFVKLNWLGLSVPCLVPKCWRRFEGFVLSLASAS